METGPGGPEPDWLWRTPLPQGDDIVRLFVPDGAIYALTSSFTLWRCTDEGSTWSVWSSVSTQLSNDFPGWARDAYVGPDGTFWLVGEFHGKRVLNCACEYAAQLSESKKVVDFLVDVLDARVGEDASAYLRGPVGHEGRHALRVQRGREGAVGYRDGAVVGELLAV